MRKCFAGIPTDLSRCVMEMNASGSAILYLQLEIHSPQKIGKDQKGLHERGIHDQGDF